MSLKSRLRRLEAGVRWLETEGVLRRWEMRMAIAERQRAIAAFRARPKVRVRPKLRVVPTLRDAAVPAAPQGEGVCRVHDLKHRDTPA